MNEQPKLTDEQMAKAAQRERLVVVLLSNGYLMPQINQILDDELSIGKLIGH